MSSVRKSKTAQKNYDKHHTAKFAVCKLVETSELTPAEPTPDGLGEWQGGPAALKGAPNWVSLKSHASRTASAKNTPGTDYASKIGPEHQKGYVKPTA